MELKFLFGHKDPTRTALFTKAVQTKVKTEMLGAAIERAGHKCEMCYAPNGANIYRYGINHDYPWSFYNTQIDADGVEEYGKATKVVLTVHHIDGDKHNNHPANLIALCQKDHLRLDKYRHIKNRKN